MEIKSRKIGNLLLVPDRERRDPSQVTMHVFLNGVPVVHFNIDKVAERKLAAIELIEQELCSRKDAGDICGFHRNTIFKLMRVKNILGIEAVLQDDRGLRNPLKYIGKLRSHIKKLLRKYPDWTDQEIADQAAADMSILVSRSAVARIRIEKKHSLETAPTKKELLDLAHEAELIEKEHKKQLNLWFDFNSEPECKQIAEECAGQTPVNAQGDAEKELVGSLEQGRVSLFAGGLIHHLFLDEIGFEELMANFPVNRGSTYQGCDIMGTIFHSIAQNIPSIEALKLVNASELGLLIGRKRIPDKSTLRDNLAAMSDLNLSDQLIDEFARTLLEQQRIDREVFFIDGHFLPYFGLQVIAKGYHTVRKTVMKGNELYMVTDLQGRPLFFITESNEIDFRPIISRSASMLQELGIKRPILVFDRGGYGINFFSKLDSQADFVTWAKHLRQESLQRIPESSFKSGIQSGSSRFLISEETRTVRESAQTAKNGGRDKPSCIELRLVVLHDVNSGKRLGIFTNNKNKPAHDIAFYMLNRWGKSENVYKEFMARFNLNYHPGYDIKELEKQPLVDNPDIKLNKQVIKILKGECDTIHLELREIEKKLTRRKDKRLTRKIARLGKELEEKTTELAKFTKKLSTIPDKISIVELLKGKKMSRCDLEKKKLYDLMQIMVHHSRERLLEIFRDCYHDKRDIKQVLDMITTRHGRVKLVGQTLIVVLDWIENRKHRQAAVELCRKLNKKKVKMVGGIGVSLSFHVMSTP